MAALQYLTVQDMLWINFQIAKKVNSFNYAKLEEATFYQYAYGESKEVPSQAARFLRGFLQLKPISELNEATGLIGAISFLEINGHRLQLEDADVTAWMSSALEARETFVSRVHPHPHDAHGHQPSVRATIEAVLRTYPVSIAGFVSSSMSA